MNIFYQDDSVVLYHGDNMAVLAELPENSVDVVVTSPPYNTQMVGNGNLKPSGFRKELSMARNLTKMTTGYTDTLPESEYQQQQVQLLDALYRILKSNGSVFYNTKLRWRDKKLIHPYSWVSTARLNIRMEIVWNRRVGLTLNARRFFDQDERIYWLFKDDWVWNQEAVGLGSVWDIAPQNFKTHACVFPEELVSHCLRGVSRPGMVVMDPYAGSGTVAAVAKKFGCTSILIERDEKYCGVIVERLSQQLLPMFNSEETLL